MHPIHSVQNIFHKAPEWQATNGQVLGIILDE